MSNKKVSIVLPTYNGESLVVGAGFSGSKKRCFYK